MERHIIKRKLQIIDFEITVTLESLGGFCENAIKHLKSDTAQNQLEAIKEAIENIKNRRDSLREKNRKANDPDLRSGTNTANYLRQFALEMQPYEKAIIESVNQLLEAKYETDDTSVEEWSKRIPTEASDALRKKLQALRKIQPNLEMTILNSNKDNK